MIRENNIAPPKNLDEKSAPYFLPYVSYVCEKPKVKYLKNIFITYSGFAINRNGLIRQCHHDYPDSVGTYLAEAAYYYHMCQSDPGQLTDLEDEKTYLLIHHPWFNYYHWLCEAIPRLWMVRKNLSQVTLLLPDYYEHSDFIMGSLEPFFIKNIFFIPEPKSVFVKTLCLPQIKPVCDAYDKKQLNEIRNFYLDYVLNVKNIKKNKGERLYLSRKKAARKKVINEDLVEDILRKYDFQIIYNEDYSFLEQISIYAHAEYLVSIHGSGLTNMLFMKSGSTIFEILKPKTNVLERPSFVFWYQAAALGFDYHQQICYPADQNDDYFFGDYEIDLLLLEENLRGIFGC